MYNNAMLALYKIKESDESLFYLFPTLKNPENIKLIKDLSASLDELIKFVKHLKKNTDTEDISLELIVVMNARDGFEAKCANYIKLKAKLIKVLQKFILEDLN